MGVSDGQIANASTFNEALASKYNDNTYEGVQNLVSPVEISGVEIEDVQAELNSLSSHVGRIANSAIDASLNWATNNAGLATDNLKDRVEGLDIKFSTVAGHTHSGDPGEGPKLDAADLNGLNYLDAVYQSVEVIGASGTSTDVTAAFTGRTANGSSVSSGVLTAPSLNRVEIINSVTGLPIFDAYKNRVYGRLTFDADVWTLTYFVNMGDGTELSPNLSATNITVYFREVFSLGTKPTIEANVFEIATDSGKNGLPFGGTTGQILSKVDATDYNSQWVAAPKSITVTTKGDLQGFSTVAERLPVGSNNQVLTADSTQPLGIKWADAGTSGGWTHYNVTYLALSAATITNDITLLTLPIKAVPERIIMKHSTSFTGGSIAAYIVKVGLVGELDRFVGDFDVRQAPSDDTFVDVLIADGVPSFAATTAVRIAAVSIGANLNAATQGSLDVWVRYSILP